MPSLLPGMAPFLEGQGFWQGFHTSLLIHLVDPSALAGNSDPPGSARPGSQSGPRRGCQSLTGRSRLIRATGRWTVCRAYDQGRYHRLIQYDGPLDLFLSAEDQNWLRTLVSPPAGS